MNNAGIKIDNEKDRRGRHFDDAIAVGEEMKESWRNRERKKRHVTSREERMI